jgi:hypothetical protein
MPGTAASRHGRRAPSRARSSNRATMLERRKKNGGGQKTARGSHEGRRWLVDASSIRQSIRLIRRARRALANMLFSVFSEL